MSLNIYIEKRQEGYYAVKLDGRLDSHTYADCENKLFPVLNHDPRVLLFDMAGLTYISSMGLRVIIKARKKVESKGGAVIISNLQPQIAKVFEIASALPDVNIFAGVEEADRYFDVMQQRELDRQK
jgi:anti-anti-sigma factor